MFLGVVQERRSCTGWAVQSACLEGQADQKIIAKLSNGFPRHVAGALDCLFFVMFQHQGAGQVNHCLFFGEDANDVALDFAVQLLKEGDAGNLARCCGGKFM